MVGEEHQIARGTSHPIRSKALSLDEKLSELAGAMDTTTLADARWLKGPKTVALTEGLDV